MHVLIIPISITLVAIYIYQYYLSKERYSNNLQKKTNGAHKSEESSQVIDQYLGNKSTSHSFTIIISSVSTKAPQERYFDLLYPVIRKQDLLCYKDFFALSRQKMRKISQSVHSL